MSNNIAGKVVVITGASSGLGETEPDIAECVRKAYALAIPADSFARAVAFAMTQPEDVDVNEILYRPTCQEF